MKEALAVVAAVLVIVAVVPYLADIVRGKTKPNIVSWFTWTILTGIATGAAFAGGATHTALLTLANTISTGLVVVLGLRFGIAKFSYFDAFCQLGASVGLVLWLVLDSPAIGVIVSVAIDFIAGLATLRHAWTDPSEETWQTYFVGAVAAALTVASITHFSLVSLLYPVYILCADGAFSGVILARGKRKAA